MFSNVMELLQEKLGVIPYKTCQGSIGVSPIWP